MNILPLNTYKYQTPVFGAKKSKKEEIGPEKLNFTEVEEEFNESLVKLYKLESDIRVQKQNLKLYYSVQDKYDYHKLLKQRQQLSAKLNRIANKSNTNYLDLLRGVLVKKEYNRFAPKIIRAASLKELAELKEWIASSFLYKASEDLLMQLMEKKKF